ncbi:hypothetical protein BLNAU_4052 [Blattamonas nauphoetae]|uniref:Uncharacterized protein n=1 Tax=Blattamonas nauphoetae TaxID=2049346 RepID=A0ABQ9YBA7_9EUKA|nr:hypothetical protein BLNAU_4052 [Blattamonas nauphoetae]
MIPSEVINLIDEGIGAEHEHELNPISVDTSTPPSQTELTISKVKRQHSTATSGSEDASSSGDTQIELPRLFQQILQQKLPSIIHEMSSVADAATQDYHTLQMSVIQLQSDRETAFQILLIQQEQIHQLNDKLEASIVNVETLKEEIEEARTSASQLQDQIDAAQCSHENQISSPSSQLIQISNEQQQQSQIDAVNIVVDQESIRRGIELKITVVCVSFLCFVIRLNGTLLLVHLFAGARSVFSSDIRSESSFSCHVSLQRLYVVYLV